MILYLGLSGAGFQVLDLLQQLASCHFLHLGGPLDPKLHFIWSPVSAIWLKWDQMIEIGAGKEERYIQVIIFLEF